MHIYEIEGFEYYNNLQLAQIILFTEPNFKIKIYP